MGGTTAKAAVATHNANVRTLKSVATLALTDLSKEDAKKDDLLKAAMEVYLQDGWPEVPAALDTDKTEYTVTYADNKIKVEPGMIID